MRFTYKKILKGEKADRRLSQDQVERLEEIGFKWIVIDHDEAFEKCCGGLEAFKGKFRHCNFPLKYAANDSLGIWCCTMRYAHTKK
mmetsp:Transcript_18582/g.27543  ORF Transcript_18582/g.27543 Transcript_18582/m.27543 type:complete len:86 (-) Transcript_18582:530-787(-)